MSAILSPALRVCLLSGSLFGLGLLLLVGGEAGARLPLAWAIGVVGFLVGRSLPGSTRLSSLMLGEVHVVEASLASVLALLIARLSTITPEKRTRARSAADGASVTCSSHLGIDTPPAHGIMMTAREHCPARPESTPGRPDAGQHGDQRAGC